MVFQRITNPEAARFLVPWFVPVDQTRIEIFMELFNRMKDRAEETFVIAVMDQNIIKGMAIAYCRKEDVFLWQARKEGLPSKYVDKAFNAICRWAKKKGFNKIVAVPNRSAILYVRRWKFRVNPNTSEVYKEL